MKILHTSDWHLGRALYGQKRYEEFEKFLDWLALTITSQGIDVLLVAGDVFDTSTPSNRAQSLYYRFLCQVGASGCRHVVITAGNHDSPSFLNAPKELLKNLNIHVIGSASDNTEDEVLVLCDKEDRPELIVCGVPYLRDRDIRTVEAGESGDDKNRKLAQGIKDHYEGVGQCAQSIQESLERPVPVVAMGHLFVTGGTTIEGDGVRELYVGSLARIDADIFSKLFDYVALGHLHVPQRVAGDETRRYSGSPLPMGFGEATQTKRVFLVAFADGKTQVAPIELPCFQELVQMKGDWDTISTKIEALKASMSRAWLEIIYTGDELAGNLRELIEERLENSDLLVLRVRNNRIVERALTGDDFDESLSDLTVDEVFAKCLEHHAVCDGDRETLITAHQEIVMAIQETDRRAE